MAKTIAGSFESFGAPDYRLDERVVIADAATHAENGAVLGGWVRPLRDSPFPAPTRLAQRARW